MREIRNIQAEKLNTQHKLRKRRQKILTFLASVVVFVTTYVMIIPAITWERTLICELDEHTHCAECYDSRHQLICGFDEHIHNDSCFDAPPAAESIYLCRKTEHTHKADCYFSDGKLKCTLDEHIHSEKCLEPAEKQEISYEDTELLPEGGNFSSSKQSVLKKYGIPSVRLFAAEPLNIDPLYLNPSGTELVYSTDRGVSWNELLNAPDTGLPGDVMFRVKVGFHQILYNDLVDADYKLIYEMPTILCDLQVEDKLYSDGKEVGSISVNGQTVTIDVNPEWAESLKTFEVSNPVISGYFNVFASINLDEAALSNPAEIKIGNKKFEVKFEDDLVEHYGDVSIVKQNPKLEQGADGHWYLNYTISVSTNDNACPNAYVKDRIVPEMTADNQPVVYTEDFSFENIDEVTKGNVSLDSDGGYLWEIGDMEAHQTESFTYRVQVNDDYIGGAPKGTIKNKAEVFSKDYPRDDVTVEYKPDCQVSVTKSRSNSVFDTAHGSYSSYTVTISAPATNEYPFENVIFTDSLKNSKSTILPYLYYKGDNWTITRKLPNSPAHSLDIEWNDIDFSDDEKSFSFTLDKLEPGEKVTLTYKVLVDKSAYPALGNTSASVSNYAGVILDNDGKPDATASTSFTIDNKVWARKVIGEIQEDDIVIPVGSSDDVFEYSGTSISNSTNPNTFTVPKGSYLYSVVVNEDGGWNMSSTSMKDGFDVAYMKYQGYVQINVYDIAESGGPSTVGTSDEAAVAALEALTPAKTVWVKIDDLTSFNFKPEDIGLESKNAYLIKYYAKPIIDVAMTNPVVSNTFALEGTVGDDEGNTYPIPGVEETVTSTVETDTTFNASKQAWYYANAIEEPIENFPQGALYWAIKADGYIAKGVELNDVASSSVTSAKFNNVFRSNSIIGVYHGNIGELSSYANLDDLLESGKLAPVGSEYYSIKYYENGNLKKAVSEDVLDSGDKAGAFVMTIEKRLTLEEGESMWIIYRTSPSDSSPIEKNYNSSTAYNNILRTRLELTDDWTENSAVKLTGYNHKYGFKEAFVADCDGTTMDGTASTAYDGKSNNPKVEVNTMNQVNKENGIDGGKMPAGKYVCWYINLDKQCNMHGKYRVVDYMPEGLDPTFVYLFYVDHTYAGSKTSASDKKPLIQFPKIDESELPEGKWKEHCSVMEGHHFNGGRKSYTYTIYWYSDENNRVIFDIDGITDSLEGAVDSRAIQLIIGTRVIDEDVLLGNQTKNFENSFDLYDSNDKLIDSDAAEVDVSATTISKSHDYTPIKGSLFPFIISINPNGLDLDSEKDELVVIDDFSDSLILDASSVKLYNADTDSEISSDNWSYSIDGHRIRFVVPDKVPLTIKYNTRVNALPKQVVSISNDAYFEHYSSPKSAQIRESNFSYETSSDIGGSAPPTVKVYKFNSNDPTQLLQNAGFTLNRCSADENGNITIGEKISSGFTDSSGSLVFGLETGKTLFCDVIYCITETHAPIGYLLDPEPHYFVIAKNQNGEYAEYPSNVTRWAYEIDSQYLCQLGNQPEVRELPSTGGSGTKYYYTFGALILFSTLMYSFILRRKDERSSE